MNPTPRVLMARAPLRANDIGGWTDTWFARGGRVQNLAIDPGVEVRLAVLQGAGPVAERVLVRAAGPGGTFAFSPRDPGASSGPRAIIRHAFAAIPIPDDVRVEVTISSPVMPGFGTGTSASVAVALLGALDRLTGGGRTPGEIAALAHRVETERIGRQSGIQDQIAAARGGACYIRMTRYPSAEVEVLPLGNETRKALDERLLVVGLGQGRDSSALHERVISALEGSSGRASILDRMSRLAEEARGRLLEGDLESYGGLMIENNECQRALAGELVCPEADAVIRIARTLGASGWKVNGAGGRGGSLTVLAGPGAGAAKVLAETLGRAGGDILVLPVTLSPTGLAVREGAGLGFSA